MANLGSKKRPAIVRVKTQARAEEIMGLCNKHGWHVIIGIEPEKPDDISDVKRLPTRNAPMSYKIGVGRNDSCPCGSGLKF